MKLDWDENKNEINISKHGIDFNDLTEVYNNPMIVIKDERMDYGEDRFIGIAKMKSIEIVLVWTLRNNTIRIISARQANKKERKLYNDKFI